MFLMFFYLHYEPTVGEKSPYQIIENPQNRQDCLPKEFILRALLFSFPNILLNSVEYSYLPSSPKIPKG